MCSLNLSLPYHVHRLITLNRTPSGRVRSECHPWLDPALHEMMVLLYNVVHILTWPSPALFRQQLFLLQVTYGANVGRILVNIDDARRGDVWSTQHLAEEPFSGSDASGLVEKEIERLSSRIHSSVQIHPFASNLDIGFVNTPGVVRVLEMWPTAPV